MAVKKVVTIVKKTKPKPTVVKKAKPKEPTLEDALDDAFSAAAGGKKIAPWGWPEIEADSAPPLPMKFVTSLVDDLVATTGPEKASRGADGKKKSVMTEKGRALVLGDGGAVRIPGVVSTDSATLDAAIGRGGVPFGRITVITGDEGSAKTTLLLHLLKNVQRMGGLSALLEKENKLDESLVVNIGVGPNLILAKPPYLEKGMETIERIVKKVKQIRADTGKRIPAIIGVDSLDGFDPKAEYDMGLGAYGDMQPAGVPRVLSRSLPRISDMIEEESIALVFITQQRAKIGVKYGKQKDQTGGKALKFHTALTIETAQIEKLKKGTEPYGIRVRANIVKNQIASPFRTAEFDVLFNEGIDVAGALLDHGVKMGVIEKKGSWYSFGGARFGGDRASARANVKKNPRLQQAIRDGVHLAEIEAKKEGRAIAPLMAEDAAARAARELAAEESDDEVEVEAGEVEAEENDGA